MGMNGLISSSCFANMLGTKCLWLDKQRCFSECALALRVSIVGRDLGNAIKHKACIYVIDHTKGRSQPFLVETACSPHDMNNICFMWCASYRLEWLPAKLSSMESLQRKRKKNILCKLGSCWIMCCVAWCTWYGVPGGHGVPAMVCLECLVWVLPLLRELARSQDSQQLEATTATEELCPRTLQRFHFCASRTPNLRDKVCWNPLRHSWELRLKKAKGTLNDKFAVDPSLTAERYEEQKLAMYVAAIAAWNRLDGSSRHRIHALPQSHALNQ